MQRREFLKSLTAAGALAPVLSVQAEGASSPSGVPVAGAYDLVVAGGSATGVCAAVTAARAGITFRYLDGHEEIVSVSPADKVVTRRGFWRKDKAMRPTWYEIPLRALLPEKAENLVCAGRMIDCTREAYGALRVMVNCNQMGEAAARHVIARLCTN